MENAEEIFQCLDDFSKRKPKSIPRELEDYLAYVARTGDPVYQWGLIKSLFKEKLLSVITEFYETTPGLDIPHCPNVDPFNYDSMKNSLVEKIDSFSAAPFTVQRICELLTDPRKQYNRIDKFMRAVEKNILVVSTREPGVQRHIEAENGEQIDAIVNGSDSNSDYNVDVEMEDMSWKESAGQAPSIQPQAGSSENHPSLPLDNVELRLSSKEDVTMDATDKVTTQYESVTPPENIATEDITPPIKSAGDFTTDIDDPPEETTEKTEKMEVPSLNIPLEPMINLEKDSQVPDECKVLIPEIRINDAEMLEEPDKTKEEEPESIEVEKSIKPSESKDVITNNELDSALPDNFAPQSTIEESSTDSEPQEAVETKVPAEVLTSSEESSSSNSSENLDGNSNSPKNDIENPTDSQEEITQHEILSESVSVVQEESKVSEPLELKEEPDSPNHDSLAQDIKVKALESDNYSITDIKSELTPVVMEVSDRSSDDLPSESVKKEEQEPEQAISAETVNPIAIEAKSEPETESEQKET